MRALLAVALLIALAPISRADIHDPPSNDYGPTRKLGRGDFVYFDPPYAPVSKTASFTAYARDGFDADDQERLLEEFRALAERGACAMLSNADTKEMRALYKQFAVHIVYAPRSINSDGAKRGNARELLVTSWGRKGIYEERPDAPARTRAARA